MTNLKIFSHKITEANGPNLRLCFWFAGCSIFTGKNAKNKCVGCWNKTVNEAQGDMMSIDQIMQIVKDAQAQGIKGVTFSGGEPLSQKMGFTQLVKRIKAETNLTVILFTGLTYQEITGMRNQEFLLYVDTVLSGRFNPEKWSTGNPIGHKDIITVTNAYSKRQIRKSFEIGTEVTIDMTTGNASITGVDSDINL